jgi:3-hydroxyisobutyrate dehydrogenase-like beta-hydroxyacid dehydrogenase
MSFQNGSDPAIGFIGFGEAGFNIARGLKTAGIGRLFAYDINTHTPRLGERIQGRAQESRTTLLESSRDLAQASAILISTVTANAALQAAEQTAPFLERRHIYADLNSVSPAVKQAVERTVTAGSARFVEAAIMAPVPPYGHRVPILLGGPSAQEFVTALAPYGMNLEILAGEVGSAAAVKMFRSIIIKGIEALTLECLLGASRYGADRRVFDSLKESFPGLDWHKLADYMIGRVVVHGERRAREMEEVAQTLHALGIEPIMAAAAARRLDWCANLNLASRFPAEGPKNYSEVLQAIAETSPDHNPGA